MPAFKSIQIGMCAVLVAASVAAATDGTFYKGYEMPPYSVQVSEGPVEVRQYDSHVLAEVTVDGSRTRAIGRGFQVLANYIFGGNAAGAKIDMTVPVAQAPKGENWTVSFMMPASFDLNDLPAAQSDAVRFVEKQPERQLVIRFSGFRTDGRIEVQTRALLTFAAQNGYDVQGAPRYYFYDDPMTPPWSRRNEIAVPIAN